MVVTCHDDDGDKLDVMITWLTGLKPTLSYAPYSDIMHLDTIKPISFAVLMTPRSFALLTPLSLAVPLNSFHLLCH